MLFMVIERFRDRDPIPVYRRVRDSGIKFPEGLKYIGSWIAPNFLSFRHKLTRAAFPRVGSVYSKSNHASFFMQFTC